MIDFGFIKGLAFGVFVSEDWWSQEVVILLGFAYVTYTLGGQHGMEAR